LATGEAMVVIYDLFGKLAGIKDGWNSYPIFFFTGLLPWTFFSG